MGQALSRREKEQAERYYVGIDIGYRTHVAVVISHKRFMTGGQSWKRARCLSFASTASGFKRFQAYLDRFSEDHHAFLGICEPTGGYYGATLYAWLLERDYDIQLVDNSTVKGMRGRIFGYLPKTDDVDARVMARICYLHEVVGEEFTLKALVQAKPEDATLLALCRDNWRLKQVMTRARNQFTQLVAMVFPELKSFFTGSVSSIAPVKLLGSYPSPAEIAAADPTELKACLWRAEAYHHAKRVDELQTLARESVGILPDPVRAWRLKWLTEFLIANYAAQRALVEQIKAQVGQRSEYRLLKAIPYTTEVTLGTIIAATGDIQRFNNLRQYVAYTGYFPRLQQSQTINHTRMSKRGNRALKRTYFQIAAVLVWFDPHANVYKDLFERKMAEGRGWYSAMPYVCAALARHVYHCLKTGELYDITRTFGSSPIPLAFKQATEETQAVVNHRFEVMEAKTP